MTQVLREKTMMKTKRGFSLIELMISVAIVGILAAVAVPSYSAYVSKSRRVEAQGLLLDVASKQVRHHSENNTYASLIGELGYGAATATDYDSEGGYYKVSVTAANATSFTLVAAPQNAQSSDECASLGYNSAGQKSTTSVLPAADCW
jgi:type IV pilus assembly protein PilE